MEVTRSIPHITLCHVPCVKDHLWLAVGAVSIHPSTRHLLYDVANRGIVALDILAFKSLSARRWLGNVMGL